MPPPPETEIVLEPSGHINPIPTGAGGIVRGETMTVKGAAECVKATVDFDHSDKERVSLT